MYIFGVSRSSSSTSLDQYLPHFSSEDEDWARFAYLLDEDLPDISDDSSTMAQYGDDDNDDDDDGENGMKNESIHLPITPPSSPEQKMKTTVDEKMKTTVDEKMKSTVDDKMKSTVDDKMKSTVDEKIKKNNEEVDMGGMGMSTIIDGIRMSIRLQRRCIKGVEEKMKKMNKGRKILSSIQSYNKKKIVYRRDGGGGVVVDPSQISLGSPSQLAPRSPKKRRDSERTNTSSKIEGIKDELGSIADRLRRKRRSDSDDSSQIKKVKIEIPEKNEYNTSMKTNQTVTNEDVCICGKKYNPKKEYLCCTKCGNNIHLKCIQISDKKAKKLMGTYVCPNCEDKGEELYCLCRTPYDDSRFYVGCDACEGWYHPSCVGITQDVAENVAEYICPLCVDGKREVEDEKGEEERDRDREYHGGPSTSTSDSITLNRSDFPILKNLMNSIESEKLSGAFLYPVDTSIYPDYPKIINHPMDISEMQRRIDQLEYHRIDELVSDFMLMLHNARTYNAEGSEIYKNSSVLEAVFDARLAEAKRSMIAKREKMRKQSECGTVDSCLDIDTDQLIEACVDPSIFESLL